tara:strand:+ start:74 stop:907 length:834 start_codon:yes stop_codon:yes gene_type:complete
MKIIKGHSGCKLDITEYDYNATITKSSYDTKYSSRLIAQANKQKNFTQNSYFKTPKIYGEKTTSGIYSFEMEYIRGLNFLSFIEKSSPQKLDYFLLNVIKYLHKNISNSNFVSYPKDIIKQKLHSVVSQIQNPNSVILNAADFIDNFESNVLIPKGYCHGDLTFSNIVFTENQDKIYLIDFLDNFFCTPMQDIVKLRQDTFHYWILHKNTHTIDVTKTKLVLEHLDKNLTNALTEYEFYNSCYKVFQLLNLLRIVVYTKDQKTYDYLTEQLELELLH